MTLESSMTGKRGRERVTMNADIIKCLGQPIPASYAPAFELARALVHSATELMTKCDVKLYPVYAGPCQELVKAGTAVSSHIIEGFGNAGERRFFMFIRLAKGSIAAALQLCQFLPPPFLTTLNAQCLAVQRLVDQELEANMKRLSMGIFGVDN
jgi:hypothetical protein